MKKMKSSLPLVRMPTCYAIAVFRPHTFSCWPASCPEYHWRKKTIGREKAAADSLSLHGESGLFRPLGLEAGAGTSDRSAWQRWALQRLQEGQSRLETLTFSDGEEYYCVLRPLRADSTCVSCHRPGSFMPGTLTGGLQIRIPMRDAKEAGAIAIGRISVVVAGLWLIVVLCIVVAGIGMRWRVLAHLQAEKLFKTGVG